VAGGAAARARHEHHDRKKAKAMKSIALLLGGLAASACLAAGTTAATSTSTPAPAESSQPCTRICRSAYEAIAKALPRDRDNVLARAILGTRGCDYAELARALHVPTASEIEAQWRG